MGITRENACANQRQAYRLCRHFILHFEWLPTLLVLIQWLYEQRHSKAQWLGALLYHKWSQFVSKRLVAILCKRWINWITLLFLIGNYVQEKRNSSLHNRLPLHLLLYWRQRSL